MAFRTTPSATFSVQVKVNVPNDNCGFDENTFIAVFKRPADDKEKAALRLLSDSDLVRDRMVGWDMRDMDSGEELPFTKANLDAVLLVDPAPYATAWAFWAALGGGRAKNL